MNQLPAMLAAFNPFEDIVSYQRNLLTSGIPESEFIFGAVGVVVLLSFIGAFVFRKQLLRRRRKHHRPRQAVHALSALANDAKSHRKRRRIRRKRRRSNPTLAETGGLPPNRSEQSTAPSSS